MSASTSSSQLDLGTDEMIVRGGDLTIIAADVKLAYQNGTLDRQRHHQFRRRDGQHTSDRTWCDSKRQRFVAYL